MKYTKPTYEIKEAESKDVITLSFLLEIEDAGEGSLGNINGEKGIFSSMYDWIS